jgi:large subunit ribosomal protein L29
MAAPTKLMDLSFPELVKRFTEQKSELFNLRFQMATGQLDNNQRIKQVKREIARCLTELRSREIAAAEALEADTARTEESV